MSIVLFPNSPLDFIMIVVIAIDQATFQANSSVYPKMDKTGLRIRLQYTLKCISGESKIAVEKWLKFIRAFRIGWGSRNHETIRLSFDTKRVIGIRGRGLLRFVFLKQPA
jgi:hypothetical protein